MSNTLSSNLRECRNKLKLSQEYVANFLGVNRLAITAIEKGTRNVTAEELHKFSEIYGVSMEKLQTGQDQDSETKVFARLYDELSDVDKMEIQNLLRYKLELRKSMGTNAE